MLSLTWSQAKPQPFKDTVNTVTQEKYFDAIFGVDQRLISGDFYYEPLYNTYRVSGHPFLIDDTWKNGSVVVEGTEYSNLSMKIDLESTSAVIRFTDIYGSDLQVRLNNDNADLIRIGDITMIPLRDKEMLFYEVYAQGDLSYLVQRKKRLIEGAGRVSSDYLYFEFSRQFLQFKGRLIPLKGIKTFYKMFPEFKDELKAFRKKNSIVISKDSHDKIRELVNFCNINLTGS
jgi:hypothetical protein